MKSIKAVFAFFILALMIFSCSTSQEVITGKHIQKRKYAKGYYVNKKASSDFNIPLNKKKSFKKADLKVDASSNKSTTPSKIVEIDKSMSVTSEDDLVAVTDKRKRPAYFDNTIRDQIEDRLGKSKDKVQKRLKKQSAKLLNMRPDADTDPTIEGNATVGFVFGVAGLLVFGLLFGLLAMIFGIIALGKISNSGGSLKGGGLAVVAIILGFIDIVAVLLFLGSL